MPTKIECEHGITPKSKCKKCLANYAKKYAECHPEKVKERWRQWYENGGKEIRRKWRVENRQLINENKRKLYRENPEYYREYKRNYAKRRIELIRAIIGRECVICGSTNITDYHEIHGKKHGTGCSNYKYIETHPKDFVPLNRNCHKGVHFCMEQLGMEWKEIAKIILKIYSEGKGKIDFENWHPYARTLQANEPMICELSPIERKIRELKLTVK